MYDIPKCEREFNGDSFTFAIQTFPLLMVCPFVHFPTPPSETTSYIIQIISYSTYVNHANHAHLLARILTPSHVFNFGRTSR